jgi:hydrogenase/urease accessory protein HupE
MFVTVQRWVKWLVGVLGYLVLKAGISLLLGFTLSVPSIIRPRLVILEYLVVLVFATGLCARYVNHAPRKVETMGLLGLVMALSFSVVLDSALPVLAGVIVLGVIQLGHGRQHAHAKPI